LKEVCAALLESDVNVKLASQLRQKVRAKAKAAFEGGGEKVKEANRKHVVQKVSMIVHSPLPRFHLINHFCRLSSMSWLAWWTLG
jgi:signal recognition particle GTPase